MSDEEKNEEKPKKKRVVGRPWPKGTSGNPSGRPKGSAEFREACRELTAVAMAVLEAAMAGKNPRAAVAAANAMLDRGWGKPTQPISGDETMAPIQVSWKDPDSDDGGKAD